MRTEKMGLQYITRFMEILGLDSNSKSRLIMSHPTYLLDLVPSNVWFLFASYSNCLEMVVKKYIQKVIERVKETVLKL
jgi:hypothetical protein